MNYDYAIHSDFLIHWTGNDIDSVYDQQWFESDRSRTNKNCDVTDRYLKRLYDILQFGIWMTSEYESPFCVNGNPVQIPSTPRSCFTELKLSQSRQHARRYGRLGIGFKRLFVIQRSGRPVIYYGLHKDKKEDIFLEQCARDFKDKGLLNFFKPMNSLTELNYDYYSESEWRILYFEELLTKRLIIDPRDSKNTKEYAYYQSLTEEAKNKLKYLIPLDGWFAMLIYPSLNVKNESQCGSVYNIQSEIERIKNNPKDHAYKVEYINWPIELDLDACRNF